RRLSRHRARPHRPRDRDDARFGRRADQGAHIERLGPRPSSLTGTAGMSRQRGCARIVQETTAVHIRPTLLLLTALAASSAVTLDAALFTPALQRWEGQRSGTGARLRGLSVVSPDVAWASGAGGTVLRTVD